MFQQLFVCVCVCVCVCTCVRACACTRCGLKLSLQLNPVIMSTPRKSLPEVAKHTHLSVCSHPEYKRKRLLNHPLTPTPHPITPAHHCPSSPTLKPRSSGVNANRPQWVTAGRREERWGYCESRKGEEGLETLETTLGKVNMIQPPCTNS